MRTSRKYPFSLNGASKRRLLSWAQQFDEVIWMDSNRYPQKHETFQAILAVDAFTALKTDYHDAFKKLEEYQTTTADWIFGYLSYDLKNDVENLQSNNFDGLNFPDLYFFQPKRLFLFYENEVEIQYLNMIADEIDEDWESISKIIYKPYKPNFHTDLNIKPRIPKESYLSKANAFLDHIKRGDIYEANLCQEFFDESANIDPSQIFLHLNEISEPPFSVFLKLNELFVLSASPERYLKRTENSVISQPIKGTAKRSENELEDLKIAQELVVNPKERSENIMITDLVRNDLSKIAEKGSVNVDEFCAVYSFKQVHQMISTISCTVSTEISSVEILKNTFPMGSMTGAPKISAMKIIEEVEETRRGLYSGAIGYFSPTNDFDFNVVIRSILYNSSSKYLSFSVGSAITISSIPDQEYEECLLKGKAMLHVLKNDLLP